MRSLPRAQEGKGRRTQGQPCAEEASLPLGANTDLRRFGKRGSDQALSLKLIPWKVLAGSLNPPPFPPITSPQEPRDMTQGIQLWEKENPSGFKSGRAALTSGPATPCLALHL